MPVSLRFVRSGDLTLNTENQMNRILHQVTKQRKRENKFIRGSMQLNCKRPGFMELLKYIKTVLCSVNACIRYFIDKEFLSSFFQKLPSANNETNSKNTRGVLEATNSKKIRLIATIDVISLFTNVTI